MHEWQKPRMNSFGYNNVQHVFISDAKESGGVGFSPNITAEVNDIGRMIAHCPAAEDADYLSIQLLTCIGNKRALLDNIAQAVDHVKRRLGKDRLRVFDVFAGSGVVSRFFKAHASLLVSNDFEDYAAAVGRCYLRNRGTVDFRQLTQIVNELNSRVDNEPFPPGFIEELYAPKDENQITADDRVFYTRDNARRLDNYRRMLPSVPPDLQDLVLGPLLSEASVHANTAGVFKGFYKDRRTGVGKFGGTGGDALRRIRGPIRLTPPVLSRFECDVEVMQSDANAAAREVRGMDLAYIDPPYNQHPYGSNYFMLNLLVNYRRPTKISKVSGIPTDWRRSGYNSKSRSPELLQDLLKTLDARFLLVSFNDEGFITPDAMTAMLRRLGRLQTIEVPYNTFRGSRNLRNRDIHVKEHLFLVERR
jgi:adenine-specific DNA-methyltransferase